MIRPLAPDDFNSFYALRKRALQTDPEAFQTTSAEFEQTSRPHAKKRFLGTVAKPQAFILGTFANDTLVGMLGLQQFHRSRISHKGFVWGVYIAPEQRKTGLGGEMLDFAIHMARSIDGLQQLQLTCISSNESALELYRSRGFVAFGHEKAAMMIDNRPLDEIHLQFFLHS